MHSSLVSNSRNPWLIIVLSAVLLTGAVACSKATAPTDDPGTGYVPPSTEMEVKSRLSEINQQGQAGSATMGLQEAIQKLDIDQAKKESLLKDLAALDAASDPDSIKTISKRMLGKL